MPNSAAEGYARASAIVDQPAPQPISAIGASGRRSTALISGIEASAGASADSNQGLLRAACEPRVRNP